MELNTRAPSFIQTFLKQYCDQKAWKIPGGQGRLDRAQLSLSEGEEEGEMGSPSVRMEGSSSDLATARGTRGHEFFTQGLLLIRTAPGNYSMEQMGFPLT